MTAILCHREFISCHRERSVAISVVICHRELISCHREERGDLGCTLSSRGTWRSLFSLFAVEGNARLLRGLAMTVILCHRELISCHREARGELGCAALTKKKREIASCLAMTDKHWLATPQRGKSPRGCFDKTASCLAMTDKLWLARIDELKLAIPLASHPLPSPRLSPAKPPAEA